MRVFRDWRGLPDAARGASVALGNFDGVHLGHAAVLRAAHAARPDAPLAVLTFEPHPREVFRPDDPPFRLTLSAERIDALAALNVSLVYELPFDTVFSMMPADAFVVEVLHQGVGARHLACGTDFAFGHRKGGDSAFLAARAEALGIGLSLVPQVADSEGPLSSTRIRRALRGGYPERAAEAPIWMDPPEQAQWQKVASSAFWSKLDVVANNRVRFGVFERFGVLPGSGDHHSATLSGWRLRPVDPRHPQRHVQLHPFPDGRWPVIPRRASAGPGRARGRRAGPARRNPAV